LGSSDTDSKSQAAQEAGTPAQSGLVSGFFPFNKKPLQAKK